MRTETIKGLNCTIKYLPSPFVAEFAERPSRQTYTIATYLGSGGDLMQLIKWVPRASRDKISAYMASAYGSSDKKICAAIRVILTADEVALPAVPHAISAAKTKKYAQSIDRWLHGKRPEYCLEVGQSSMLAEMFDLNKHQAHMLQLRGAAKPCQSTVAQYKAGRIPYSEESFDLILCFMELHNMPPAAADILLLELHRVMRPGGLLVIREYDAPDSKALDAVYSLHGFLTSGREHRRGRHYGTVASWTKKVLAAGFRFGSTPDDLPASVPAPVRAYVATYYRPEKERPVLPFFRIVTQAPLYPPREKYRRRWADPNKRDLIHWGQRKLLLNEIEFFTVVCGELIGKQTAGDVVTPRTVVYVGAAPGTHLLMLHRLFPFLQFVLYDPREFDRALADHPNFELHAEFFTDDTARGLAERFGPAGVFFISDIRNVDIVAMDSAAIESSIKRDQSAQMRWYHLLDPLYAMFKFRLPWDDGVTCYLAGEVYLQPFAPLSSTETRLVVRRGAGMAEYDNRAYEEQLFYHNKNVRPARFAMGAEDALHDYDTAAEMHILTQYNELVGKCMQRVGLSAQTSSVAKLSNSISSALSHFRRLNGEQPLPQAKKEFVARLAGRGLVPRDMPLTQRAYCTYVFPIYEKLKSMGMLLGEFDSE